MKSNVRLALEGYLELIQKLLQDEPPKSRPRGKFIVIRTDGQPIPKKARYFVLRVDYHHPRGDTNNMETWCARTALQHYVTNCRDTNNPKCKLAGKAAKALLKESK